MLIKSRIIIICTTILTVICAALISGIPQKQHLQVVDAQGNESPLTFGLSSTKTQYLQNEPIPVKMSLSNQTAEAISLMGLFAIGQNINIVSHNVRGEEFRFQGDKYILCIALRLWAMTPGKQIGHEFLLPQDVSNILFPRPGRYDLRFQFVYATTDEIGGPRSTASSNPISVNIIEPTGIDRAADEYIRNVINPASSERDRTILKRARQYFSTHFGQSVYAAFNTYELARILEELGEDRAAEDAYYSISDVDFFYSKEVENGFTRLASKRGVATPTSKRVRIPTNIPIGIRIEPADISVIPIPPIPPPVRIFPLPTP